MIVCDTNVLVSAFIFPGGWPDKIVRAFLLGRLKHATSPDILGELKKVLNLKFHLPNEKTESVIRLISTSSQLVYPTERISMIKADPADNRILECAVTAPASAIISGDKQHLLPLKKYNEILILSPHQFAIAQGII